MWLSASVNSHNMYKAALHASIRPHCARRNLPPELLQYVSAYRGPPSTLLAIPARRWVTGPPTPGNANPDPVDDAAPRDDSWEGKKERWKNTAYKMSESALTTFASISILGCVLSFSMKFSFRSNIVVCPLRLDRQNEWFASYSNHYKIVFGFKNHVLLETRRALYSFLSKSRKSRQL